MSPVSCLLHALCCHADRDAVFVVSLGQSAVSLCQDVRHKCCAFRSVLCAKSRDSAASISDVAALADIPFCMQQYNSMHSWSFWLQQCNPMSDRSFWLQHQTLMCTFGAGGIQNRFGSLFFILIYMSVMSLSSLPLWMEDRLLFFR